MTTEFLITKLNQNLEIAKESLRTQLSEKVSSISKNLEGFSTTEIREELEGLIDDFLSQFTNVYQEFISYIEDEIPSLPLSPKNPKKKKKKSEIEVQKKEFLKPTYIHRAFTEEGLRVAKDAKPIIMDLLNKKIKEDIEKIKNQLPTFIKGDKRGEKKRITIRPDDLSDVNIFQRSDTRGEKELESIPLDLNGGDYRLLILLKQIN